MKFKDPNVYGDWDSPHTFCRFQLDDPKHGLVCTDFIFESLGVGISTSLSEERENHLMESCKCPFKETDIKDKDSNTITNGTENCALFEYHKHNKNKNAVRFVDKDKLPKAKLLRKE